MQKILLTFVDDIYEDLELWYPKLRCEEAGYAIRLAAPEIKTYQGKHGYPAKSDLLLKDTHSEDFFGLLIPGGFMPDKLRRDAKGSLAYAGVLRARQAHRLHLSRRVDSHLREDSQRQTRYRLARHQG